MRQFKGRSNTTQTNLPVVIVGAGPVGLTLAVDLAQRGVPVVLIDQKTVVGKGSRAVTFAKRSLEIFDKLGIGDEITNHGIQWSVNNTYFYDEKVDARNLQPEAGLKRPAYVNIQQYHVEDALVTRANQLECLDIRWGTQLLSHKNHPHQDSGNNNSGVQLKLADPQGEYELQARYLIAADGAHSRIRQAMGLSYQGREFKDRFLITDIIMQAEFLPERHFWFSPGFHEGYSVLLHKQPDNIWRVDFQLGWDTDPVAEADETRVKARLHKMLGDDAVFDIQWVSVYTFECRMMENFRHGSVFFIGDAAHRVSPFGARGANSGIQDADNLGWKLAAVLTGQANDSLLDSYSEERIVGAKQNLSQSSRSTDFITPKSKQSLRFRDAILSLSKTHTFAKQMINSGRLSTATDHLDSSLNAQSDQSDSFDGGILPGQVCLDAKIKSGWLMERLGNQFSLLVFSDLNEQQQAQFDLLRETEPQLQLINLTHSDSEGFVKSRYGDIAGMVYLVRPDNYVAARWLKWDFKQIEQALRGCLT